MEIDCMDIGLLIKEMMKKNSSYAEPFGKEPTSTVEVTARTLDLIYLIRDKWFPNEEVPMTAGEAINLISCAIYYKKLSRKK